MPNSPHEQGREDQVKSTPESFDTPEKGFKMLADSMWGDFNDKKILLSQRFKMMNALETEVEKRYRKGDKLIDKKGTVWVWRKRDGSQRGEIMKLFLQQPKEFFSPVIQQEIESHDQDQHLLAKQKAQLERNRKIEKSKEFIANLITKDFPEHANVSEYVTFWTQVYCAIDDGCYRYRLATEFLQNSKIKDLVIRKQVRENGFVLFNPNTREFIWFAGGANAKPIKGVAENKNYENPIDVDYIIKMKNKGLSDVEIERMKKYGILDAINTYHSNGDLNAYFKIIEHLNTFSESHSFPALNKAMQSIIMELEAIKRSGKDITKMNENEKDAFIKKHQEEISNMGKIAHDLQKQDFVSQEDMSHYLNVFVTMW